jgi:hypothetical protein
LWDQRNEEAHLGKPIRREWKDLLRIVCACAGAVRHKLESGRLTFDRSGEKIAGGGQQR